MTGPEHYEEAERLAAKIDKTALKPEEFWVVHLAQVHATLALAAATALNDAEGGLGAYDHDAWRTVAGVPAPGHAS